VQGQVSRDEFRPRFAVIHAFEHMLADESTTILKLYLHIDKAEQKNRLQGRLDEKDKHWKFNPADLTARALWRDYPKAYAGALSTTSTEWAPWYIISANRKGYCNLIISTFLLKPLKDLMSYYIS
jgi:polyphosphate kinase 2 (PPK2 family)